MIASCPDASHRSVGKEMNDEWRLADGLERLG
jgi:hypothetical protein